MKVRIDGLARIDGRTYYDEEIEIDDEGETVINDVDLIAVVIKPDEPLADPEDVPREVVEQVAEERGVYVGDVQREIWRADPEPTDGADVAAALEARRRAAADRRADE